ncbi:MAG: hypothetical protein NTU53_04185 [Planctomycetota bacterium]|nr:hypothetical protein [Planctomycetota bacterium]
MLILRIKQAECALADGRLEEAFDLVQAKDLREHRRGQDLAGQLARALVQRARQHLGAGQLTLASTDCDKAARLAGNLPDVAEIRAAVISSMLDKQQAQHLQTLALAAAHRQIEQGQLSVGQKLLSDIQEGNPQAAALRQDLAARRVMIDAIVEKAAAALQRDDWESAVNELASARGARLSDTRLRELIAQTTRLVTRQTQSAIESGRLDRASLLLKRLARIADGSVDSEQVRQTLDQCRLAFAAVQAGQPRQAEQIMRRLAVVLPTAAWVQSALKYLEQAGDATDQLAAGPLGLLDGSPQLRTFAMNPQDAPNATPKSVLPLPSSDPLPPKFIIQVDGIGSFLVLRDKRITIGALSSTPTPDVGFLAEAQTPPLVIERVEDDYFVKSPATVPSSASPQRPALLTTGQRIAISTRCRMTFRLPSPASTTAVLELNSARLPRSDVRHIVLLDRELILGPGPSAHIRADELPEPAVLHLKDGRLYCQTKNEISIEDQPADRNSPIPIGRHLRVGAVTFVVTRG